MTILNIIKAATTTGGGGGGGGGSVTIIGGPPGASVISTNPTGSELGLVTRPIIPQPVQVTVVNTVPGTVTNTYGTVSLVPYNTPATVVTYTSTGNFQVTGFVAGGDMNAKFTMLINGSPVLTARSTVAQQTVETSFLGANPTVTAGQTILVQVLQLNSGLQGNFEGTILGTLS